MCVIEAEMAIGNISGMAGVSATGEHVGLAAPGVRAVRSRGIRRLAELRGGPSLAEHAALPSFSEELDARPVFGPSVRNLRAEGLGPPEVQVVEMGPVERLPRYEALGVVPVVVRRGSSRWHYCGSAMRARWRWGGEGRVELRGGAERGAGRVLETEGSWCGCCCGRWGRAKPGIVGGDCVEGT